jgi:hypothetical protein
MNFPQPDSELELLTRGGDGERICEDNIEKLEWWLQHTSRGVVLH